MTDEGGQSPSFLAETSAATVPLVSHLSYSQLDSFTDCEQKYYLSRVQKHEREAKGYFIGGGAVHRTIEEAEGTGWWGDPAAWEPPDGVAHLYFLAMIADELSQVGGPDQVKWGGRKTKAWPQAEDDAWWCTTGGVAMLRRYAALRRLDAELGHTVVSYESKLTTTLPSGRLLVGYPDAVLTHAVRDYKTGTTYSPTDGGMQAALYEYQRRQLGMDPLSKAEYVFLRAGDERLVFTVELEPWLPLIEMMIEQVETRLNRALERPDDPDAWEYSPSKDCAWCDVAASCKVGQRYLSLQPTEVPS